MAFKQKRPAFVGKPSYELSIIIHSEQKAAIDHGCMMVMVQMCVECYCHIEYGRKESIFGELSKPFKKIIDFAEPETVCKVNTFVRFLRI